MIKIMKKTNPIYISVFPIIGGFSASFGFSHEMYLLGISGALLIITSFYSMIKTHRENKKYIRGIRFLYYN